MMIHKNSTTFHTEDDNCIRSKSGDHFDADLFNFLFSPKNKAPKMYLRQCFPWHKHQGIDRVEAFRLQFFDISRCDSIYLFHCANENSILQNVLRLKAYRCVQCVHDQQANSNSLYKPEVLWSIVGQILLLHHYLWLFEQSILQLHFEPWFSLAKMFVPRRKIAIYSFGWMLSTVLFSVCHFMFCNGKSRSDWNVWMRCVCASAWVFVFCALLMLPFDVAYSATAAQTQTFDITKRTDRGELHLYTPTSNTNLLSGWISRIIS